MNDNTQSQGTTVLIIVALALMAPALCGCKTLEVRSEGQRIREEANSVIEKKIASIDDRLLPIWAAGISEYLTEGIAGMLALLAAYQGTKLNKGKRDAKANTS